MMMAVTMKQSLSSLSTLSFVLMLTTAVVAAPRNAAEVAFDCTGRPADVVFVLDASNSIWRPDFLRQLEFVKDVIDFFTIGHRSMMVGVITYAAYPQLQFQLNYYQKKSDIRAAIDIIRQDGGYETRTHEALRYLRERAFSERYGARRRVAHVAVVITDGRSDNKTMTALEASKLREDGVHLFAVGVGINLDMAELKTMASEPADYYTFRVESYEGLERIKNLLAIKTCEVTHPPTTTPRPTTRGPSRATTTPSAARRHTTNAAVNRGFATPTFGERTQPSVGGSSKTEGSDGSHSSGHPDGGPRAGSGSEGDYEKNGKVTLEQVIKGSGSGAVGAMEPTRPTIRFETPRNPNIQEPPVYIPLDSDESRYHELQAKNLTSIYEREIWRPEKDERDAGEELEHSQRHRRSTAKPNLHGSNSENGHGYWETHGNGDDYGNGNGGDYGNEDDDDYGNGDGNGNDHGNGDGNGHGNGHGDGNGNGNGNGDGDGNEKGNDKGGKKTGPPKASSEHGIWTFDRDGRLVRQPGSEGDVDGGQLPPIPDDSEMFIEGDEIWILEKNGKRRLIGCIINGTHYIGHWIFDEDGTRKWFGYPSTDLTDRIRSGPQRVLETAERRRDQNEEKDGSELSRTPDSGSPYTDSDYMVEEVDTGSKNGDEDDPDRPQTDEAEVPGYWGQDEKGRDVYYLYVSPGVFELVYPDDNGEGSSSVDNSTEEPPHGGRQEPRGDEEREGDLTPNPNESQLPGEETEQSPHEVLDPNGRNGHWGVNEKGRQVWYLYTCPGVYVQVPDVPDLDENGQPITNGQAECAGVDDDGNEVVYTYVGPGEFRKEPTDVTDHEDPYHAVGGKPESSVKYPGADRNHAATLSPPSRRRPGLERDEDTEAVDENFRRRVLPDHEADNRKPSVDNGKPEIGVYKFDEEGNFERLKVVDAPNLKVPDVDDKDEVYVDGGQIYVKKPTGTRRVIGCVINGTHYIGIWVFDENGNQLLYGYPSKELTERLKDKNRSSRPVESTNPARRNERPGHPVLDYENGAPRGVDRHGNPYVDHHGAGQDVAPQESRGNFVESDLHDSQEPETATKGSWEDWTPPDSGRRRGNNVILDPNGRTGFWEHDDKGRPVWYRYTCPGVYEPAPEGPPYLSPEDIESGEAEVDGELGCSGKDEDGRDVYYVYVGPGEFQKIPRGSKEDKDRDNNRSKSAKDVASEKEAQKQGNKTKQQPSSVYRSTTVSPSAKTTRPRLAPKNVPGSDPKKTKHHKPTKGTDPSKNDHDNDKEGSCRPREPLDLVFVLDSKSEDDTSVSRLWNLTRDILSHLDLEDDRIQVRFIEECLTPGSTGFDLGEYETKDSLMRALDASLHPSPSTTSSSAQLIQKMVDAFRRDDVVGGNHGNGVAKRRVGVYVTDGQSDDMEETVEAAQRAKFNDEVEIISVGVGQKVNPTELRAVASCEVDRHFYALNHHSKAPIVARKISKVLCLGR